MTNSILAAALVLLVCELITGRPQETVPSTGLVDTPIVDSSFSSCCPNPSRPCSPCEQKTAPKFYQLLPATGCGRPFGFIYKAQDGTFNQQTGVVGPDGVVMRGKFSYIDPCTGKKYEEEYVADKDGFRILKLNTGDEGTSGLDQDLAILQNDLQAAGLEDATTVQPSDV